LLAACNGHPFAKIAWPHYVLHDAANTIKALRQSLATPAPVEYEFVGEGIRPPVQFQRQSGYHWRKHVHNGVKLAHWQMGSSMWQMHNPDQFRDALDLHERGWTYLKPLETPHVD
jgi:hypothetical protein